MLNKTFYAWAVNTNSAEGHGFLGRYYFGHAIPAHLEGGVVALFKTREEARGAIRGLTAVYNPFPKIAVSRVRVSINEVRQD